MEVALHVHDAAAAPHGSGGTYGTGVRGRGARVGLAGRGATPAGRSVLLVLTAPYLRLCGDKIGNLRIYLGSNLYFKRAWKQLHGLKLKGS